jgi:hypothetical protein
VKHSADEKGWMTQVPGRDIEVHRKGDIREEILNRKVPAVMQGDACPDSYGVIINYCSRRRSL